MVVVLFVLVNAAVLAADRYGEGFSASTSILVEEKNILQPLMQGPRWRPRLPIGVRRREKKKKKKKSSSAEDHGRGGGVRG